MGGRLSLAPGGKGQRVKVDGTPQKGEQRKRLEKKVIRKGEETHNPTPKKKGLREVSPEVYWPEMPVKAKENCNEGTRA